MQESGGIFLKWFKHYSNARHDPKLIALERVFGVNTGIGIWWKFVELCAEQVEDPNDSTFEFDADFLRKELRINWKSFQNFLRTSQESSLFSFKLSEKLVIINFSKLLEVMDKHYKYNKKRVVSNDQPTTLDKDKDKDKEYKIYKSDFDFDLIYENYPRKVDKFGGLKKCKTQITSQKKYDDLGRAIEKYKNFCAENGYTGKYVKNFNSFMTNWPQWLENDMGECNIDTTAIEEARILKIIQNKGE